MGGVGEDAGGEGVGGDGVAPQGGHLRPEDAQHLEQEALHEAVEPAGLPQARGLADVEQVQVAKVVLGGGMISRYDI